MEQQRIYALYKGDAMICTGTIFEIAELLKIKPQSVSYMKTQAYARKPLSANYFILERF